MNILAGPLGAYALTAFPKSSVKASTKAALPLKSGLSIYFSRSISNSVLAPAPGRFLMVQTRTTSPVAHGELAIAKRSQLSVFGAPEAV
jgi:hypothetical protein